MRWCFCGMREVTSRSLDESRSLVSAFSDRGFYFNSSNGDTSDKRPCRKVTSVRFLAVYCSVRHVALAPFSLH